MRYYIAWLLLTMYICLDGSVAFAQMRYHVIEIPDEVPAQLLMRDGQILGLDWSSGNAVLWSSESGVTSFPAPDGSKWIRVIVSPGGRFLGDALKPDNSSAYYVGQLGKNLSSVKWPASLPNVLSQASSSEVSDNLTICIGTCIPILRPPICVPRPPLFSANAINDDGVIAGVVSFDKRNGCDLVLRPAENHAFRLYPNEQIDMLNDNNMQAMSVNSRGDALINSTSSIFPICANNTKLWTVDGQLLSHDPTPGYKNFALQVLNDKGEIAGTASNEGNETTSNDPASVHLQGFRWSNEKGMIALDMLPRFTNGIVHGLNNDGIVVGEASNTNSLCGPISIFDPTHVSTVAVMWKRNGHVVDLNTVIENTHKYHLSSVASLRNSLAINDGGQILAFGIDSNGNSHNYLLSPIRKLHSDADERHRHGGNDDSTRDED
jgi:hypothetical protein